jgi:hypothetical protein
MKRSKMSSDDAAIVTCEWFVKDVPRTKSYPVKALKKHVELDLEQLADKSTDELAKLYHDSVSGKAPLTQTSKETVPTKTGTPSRVVAGKRR